jgi:branched-chain amino acid transport system permease protein
VHAEFRPTPAGLIVRAVVAALLVLVVFLIPTFTNTVWDNLISKAAIFAIIGLSINILTGYAGQISLGHQAFVGIGAFMSAFMVKPSIHASFFLALPVAGLTGAFLAFGIGLIALRIRGLYLALITLAFGLVAQETIFFWRPLTGAGGGAPAPRPSGFESNQAYAYLCLMFLGLFLVIDWRLAKTKAGRAIVAVRNNERVAATIGINVTSYKLLAFVLSGFLAGVAGSLFAHQTTSVDPANFDFITALTWVVMAVVGGLGSRAGIVVGSAFFALFPDLVGWIIREATFHAVKVDSNMTITIAEYAPLVGALLLLLTVTRYPGGIGQQLLPIRRWLSGGPLVDHEHRHEKSPAATAEEAEGPELTESDDVPSSAAGGNGSAASSDTAVTTQIPAVPPRTATVRRGLRAFRRKG